FEENYGNATVRALNRVTAPVLEEMGVFSPRGILLVARAEESDRFHTDFEELGMTALSVQAARAWVPILSDSVVLAALNEGAMDIDTDAVLQGYAREARRFGARIETNATVTAIKPGRSVVANAVEVSADVIVNAAGAWADAVAALAGVAPLGLQPYRRSMARMPAPGGQDVREWPMLFGAGESWYAKPDAGSWIVSPAEEDPVQPMDAWADDMVLAEGMARYEAHVTEPVTRIEMNWAGLRTFAPDRALVIGEEPTCAGFFWLAGQGGYGFQTSAGAATHLASAVAGRPSPLGGSLTEALSPLRFR
ncbi:MAG: FAD-binding oxidoreductase, partial [Pseudomonadota bacterium]